MLKITYDNDDFPEAVGVNDPFLGDAVEVLGVGVFAVNFAHRFLSFRIKIGSIWVSRSYQNLNQRRQKSLTSFARIMNKLKETQINRQLLLGNAPMRSQPRP